MRLPNFFASKRKLFQVDDNTGLVNETANNTSQKTNKVNKKSFCHIKSFPNPPASTDYMQRQDCLPSTVRNEIYLRCKLSFRIELGNKSDRFLFSIQIKQTQKSQGIHQITPLTSNSLPLTQPPNNPSPATVRICWISMNHNATQTALHFLCNKIQVTKFAQ